MGIVGTRGSDFLGERGGGVITIYTRLKWDFENFPYKTYNV